MLNGNTLIYVSIGLVSYIAGILSGFYLRSFLTENEKKQLDGNMIVLVVVTLVWSLSMFVDILSPTYETSPLVHGLMGAIVGFFYKPKGDTK